MTQGQFFKRSLTGLNSEFSFSETSCLTKAEEPSLPYYLPIAGGGIFGFIPFPTVLVLCEMQSVRSRIWTRIAVSISRDDNHYTTGTSERNGYRRWFSKLLGRQSSGGCRFNELKTVIQAVRICSQYIGMKFGREKCAMLITSGKRQMTEEIKSWRP